MAAAAGRDRLRGHARGVVIAGEAADLLARAQLHDHRERAVVHKRHAEALDRPDDEQQRRERKLAARADDLSGGRGKAHDDETDERARKAAGDRPLAADLLGDRSGGGKADDGGETAEDREDHRGARNAVEIVNDIVSDVRAERVIGHEPEELRAEDRKQHALIGLAHRLIVVDGRFDRGHLLAESELFRHLPLDLVLLDRGKQHERGDHHQHRGDDERQLDDPEIALMVGGVDVIAQHKEQAEHRGERAADVAHDVDDAVGLGAQGLGRDVRHESDGGVAVHHHKDENDGHHCDHPGNVVIVEEQRDKRERDRRNERADKDIRHALADLRVRSIRKTAEERQKDERGKIVARHDDADDPLHMQDVVRVACLEIGGRHAVEPAGEDIRQKCGAPGVVHLPEQENTEKGKADEKGPLVIELHCCFLSARDAPRASLLWSLHHTGKTLSLQPVFPALQYRYEVIPMKQCKKAGTIAAAAIGAAAAGYLFLIAPGRSRAGQRFPFRGQNIAHRGLYDAAQGIPENSLAAFRAAAEGGYGAELDTRLTKDGVVVVSHDSNIRRIFTTGFQSEWAHTMERQLLNVSPKARLKSVDYGRTPKDYQHAPIRITFRYEIPEYALKGDQGEMFFKPFVLNNLYTQVLSYLRIDTSLEKRTYGFKDGCSRLVEMEENLKLPAGYEWQGKEKRDQMDGSGAGFTGYMGQNGNQLQVKTSLRLKKRVYEASDWESFRNAVNTAKGYGEYIVVKK